MPTGQGSKVHKWKYSQVYKGAALVLAQPSCNPAHSQALVAGSLRLTGYGLQKRPRRPDDEDSCSHGQFPKSRSDFGTPKSVRYPNIFYNQKRPVILRTTHMAAEVPKSSRRPRAVWTFSAQTRRWVSFVALSN